MPCQRTWGVATPGSVAVQVQRGPCHRATFVQQQLTRKLLDLQCWCVVVDTVLTDSLFPQSKARADVIASPGQEDFICAPMPPAEARLHDAISIYTDGIGVRRRKFVECSDILRWRRWRSWRLPCLVPLAVT